MKIAVTGGAGYIGSTLTRALLSAGHHVRVLDRLYFGQSVFLGLPEGHKKRLEVVRVDVRRSESSHFKGCEAVVDLAGISNDPACDLDSHLTRSVNFEGGVHTAQMAREVGVRRYVFASSCSVYGAGGDNTLTEESAHHPVSLYAECKSAVEKRLLDLESRSDMEIVRLRFATVFGYSAKMRFDLAINIMTKHAYIRQQITVAGGGKQWRPFVHVGDAADSVRAVLDAPAEKVKGEVYNVGGNENNLRISTLAYRIRDRLPGTEVTTLQDDADSRSYHVRFDKIVEAFPDLTFRPIEDGIDEIIDVLRRGVVDPDERRWYTVRHYEFLAEVDRAFDELAIDGRVLN